MNDLQNDNLLSAKNASRFFIDDTDILLFLRNYPQIGIFKIDSSSGFVFVDFNACRLLDIPYDELPEGSTHKTINIDEFMCVIDLLLSKPEMKRERIYRFFRGSELNLLQLFITEFNGCKIGIIKDYTRFMLGKDRHSLFSEYDPVTNLMYHDAFVSRITAIIENRAENSFGFMASVHINGVENINSVFSHNKSESSISLYTSILKKYETEDIIISTKSYKDFHIFFNQIKEDGVLNIFSLINNALSQCISENLKEQCMENNNDEEYLLSANFGYCSYPQQASAINSLFNRSDYALFETLSNKIGPVNKFSAESYAQNKVDFNELQLFNTLISENLFTYFFQPIVNAETGEIFAYEALMRTKGNINMSPLKVLEIAKKHDRLYDIELKTFKNAVKFFFENQMLFDGKKLFINSIPNALLSHEDFESLRVSYSALLSRLVVEITEISELSDLALEVVKSRRLSSDFELAIDDYGTGFSNTTMIFKCMPNYLKIDRTLISNIHNSPQQQQFILGILHFTSVNGIHLIAEGVESAEELKTVIELGIEYVQGYYTAMPSAEIISSISPDIVQFILQVNAEKKNNESKKNSYFTVDDDVLDLSLVNIEKYTDITIKEKELTVINSLDCEVCISMYTPDNSDCTLTLSNINIKGRWAPAINVGRNSRLHLIVEGINIITFDGIYVPDSSELLITGSGRLKICTSNSMGVCIGSDFENAYGKITLNHSGKIEIISSTEHSVGIGGGVSVSNSEIMLLSGTLMINSNGIESIAIGSCVGNAKIHACCEHINIFTNSYCSLGIGSISESTDIYIKSDLKIVCLGNTAVGVGALDGGTAVIVLENSNLDVLVKSRQGACIGTVGGSTDCNVLNSVLELVGEGREFSGIGDFSGKGAFKIKQSKININLHSQDFIRLGAKESQFEIQDSTVNGERIQSSRSQS